MKFKSDLNGIIRWGIATEPIQINFKSKLYILNALDMSKSLETVARIYGTFH